MFDTLSGLSDEHEALKKRMKADAKKGLKEAAKEFFEKFPEVQFFGWHQYTPGFNDGDPCYNSISEYGFIAVDAKDEDGELITWDMDDFNSSGDAPEGHLTYEQMVGTPLGDAWDTLFGHIYSLEDVWEDVFGTNVKVVCDPKEVTTSDYYCGY